MNLNRENHFHRSSRQPTVLSRLVLAGMALLLGAFTTSAATLTVTTNADSGAGSLRAAIAAATNGDSIVFSLPSPSTITLTSGGLVISNRALTIAGPGPSSLAIDGYATNTVFSLSGNPIAISGLTISNGHGGVYCNAGYPPINNVITISNVVITGSQGSGIFSVGADLQIINSTVSSNSASSGGGICFQAGAKPTNTLTMVNTLVSANLATNGGAIYLNEGLSRTIANLSGVTIIGNQATAQGGGIYNGVVNLSVNNSVVSSNLASCGITSGSAHGRGGGGIYVAELRGMTASNLTMMGNVSLGYGGAICADGGFSTLSNSTLIGNSAGYGGAIANVGLERNAAATMFNCVVVSNYASWGGAIFGYGFQYPISAQVFNSTFSANWATNSGGAIYNDIEGNGGYVTVVGSTFNGNSATLGGAILSSGAPALGWTGSALVGITNSTFSGNTAGTGGAIYNVGSSDGRYGGTASANVQLLNSTFSDNNADNGGVLFTTLEGSGAAHVLIGSSILNAGDSGGTILNFGADVASAGYNLSSDNANGFLTNVTDLVNIDPMLGPLQDNGGRVCCKALLPGSPAIDGGNNFSTYTNDERGLGFTRNYGPTDIGAFELQPPPSPFVLWQFQNFGCTNCPQADPDADPDGDGASNLAEFQAGTNPNSSASTFRILSVTPQGNDLLVTWKTVGGHTNVVQVSGSLANGSFSDVSSSIVIPGNGDTTASFLVPGAATGGANSFYRVRLGP